MGLHGATLVSPFQGSASHCTDTGAPQVKAPEVTDRKVEGQRGQAWHFLVSQDQQEGTGPAGGTLWHPLPCASFPALPDSSPTTPAWSFLGPLLEADPPAPTETPDVPESLRHRLHGLHLQPSCRLCATGQGQPLPEPLSRSTLQFKPLPTQLVRMTDMLVEVK